MNLNLECKSRVTLLSLLILYLYTFVLVVSVCTKVVNSTVPLSRDLSPNEMQSSVDLDRIVKFMRTSRDLEHGLDVWLVQSCPIYHTSHLGRSV